MRQDCPECQRLWREYAAATTTHISLENKLRQLAPGSDAAQALARDIAAATAIRETARQAIHKHESANHGEIGTAGLEG
jgi:hypothetical protein